MIANTKDKMVEFKGKIVRRLALRSTIIAVFLIIILSISFLFYKVWSMTSKLDQISNSLLALQTDFSSTTTKLEGNILKSYSELLGALDTQKNNVGNIANQLGSYQQQVGTISSTVSTLQKLSKTDPELLQKYSKVFFLNENYSPARLIEIPNEFSYSDTKTLTIHADVWPNLQKLFLDAKRSGVDLYALSAFRSFDEQNAIKGQYSIIYGAGTANQFSADQGYSEHQLGTTVDFMTSNIKGALSSFEGTPAFTWLTENAHKYGFTMSYPKNNPYYIYEPWHWRYVGITLATELFNTKRNFYDMDQRLIDEYLVVLF